jgi:hypothetical protein
MLTMIFIDVREALQLDPENIEARAMSAYAPGSSSSSPFVVRIL